jgi:tripartite-type tricarboxylate transporter receptor subunit TctC
MMRGSIAALTLLLGCLLPETHATARDAATIYPERLVKLIVPFPAGGAVDIVARSIATRLNAAWKQPVVVENVVGASGAIAAQTVSRSAKDGYTLMAAVGTTTSILKIMKPNLPFEPINDFAPVSLAATFPTILVVRPDLPVRDVGELVTLLKANPGKYTFGSPGVGSNLHLAGELFKLTTATDILHVPFRGSAPAASALLGGHVDMNFEAMPTIWNMVKAGNLRALGIAGPARLPVAPELPAISETLPGFEVTAWEGILAPAGTPSEIVVTISEEIQRIGRDPEFIKSMMEIGAVVRTSTPDEFAAFISSDHVKWQQVISKAGIKIE